MTSYADAPPGAAPMNGPDDEELIALDAAAQLARDIDREAYRIRVRDAAAAKVRAEKVGDTDFDQLFLDRDQLRSLPPPVPLIDRVLPRNCYAVLRGRDQSFKSFVALDWALCLATGKRWQDHDLEPTRVLYVAGEGADGLSKRVAAWEAGWGHQVPTDMFVTRRLALNMYEPGPAYTHLLHHVTAAGYGLIVIDTLRRVSGRAEGNGSDMGVVIDHFDEVKQATAHGSVLVISHTDKHDVDSRGYSGIEDDADVVWHAKRNEMNLRLELTKMKDGADGRLFHLAAAKAAGSLVLTEAAGSEAEVSNENQIAILDALRGPFRDGATPTDLITETGIAKPTLYRALNRLEDLGHIQNTGTKRSKYFEIPPPELDPETSETQPSGDTHE